MFKFMMQMLRGHLPYFYDIILGPLVNNHSYNTRSGRYRHPLINYETGRRSIAHQIILLYESTRIGEYDNYSLPVATRTFKRYLLANQ